MIQTHGSRQAVLQAQKKRDERKTEGERHEEENEEEEAEEEERRSDDVELVKLECQSEVDFLEK